MTESVQNTRPKDKNCHEGKAGMDTVMQKVSRTDGSVLNLNFAFNEVDQNVLLVERTIEIIGMGPFQWRLAFTCAFGFVVDQVNLNLAALLPGNLIAQLTHKREDSAGIYKPCSFSSGSRIWP